MTNVRPSLVFLSSVLAAVLGHLPAHADQTHPSILDLPPGFQPEGIAAGRRSELYVGNIHDGSILTLDPRSGDARILVPPAARRIALGLALDARTNDLFVAGGPTGHALVYDGVNGALIADYALGSGVSIVNGVVVTRDAVYFTDSAQPVIYQLPLGHGGHLPAQDQVRAIPLTGDFPVVPRAFNANGIVASPDGRTLIIVHTAAGKLFRVDPETGATAFIDLGGGSLPNGDGLVLRGHTLFVVQNLSNQIAVVALAAQLGRGTIVRTITDPRFDVITSAALVGDDLYVTNARYTTPPSADTVYSVVRVPIEDDVGDACDGR
jgi:sugar lactone lactonase YvrE